jgi:hypothetical protein
MAKTLIIGRDGSILEDDDVIPDGATLKVPLSFADGTMDSAILAALRSAGFATNTTSLHDGQGNSAGFKPGYCFGDAIGPGGKYYQTAGERARQAYLLSLTNAWQLMPPPKRKRSLVDDDGRAKPAPKLTPQPPQRDGHSAAWHNYVNNLPNAWRNP